MKLALAVVASLFAASSALEVSFIHKVSNSVHYGDPKTGCESDEQAVQVQGVSGDFCSPKCSASMTCPSDKPSGVAASPMCALQTTTGDKYCALICSPTTDFYSLRLGDAQCGTGSCEAISGVGICTYSSSIEVSVVEDIKEIVKKVVVEPKVGTNPTHYGDPKTGCESDEQAVQVQNVQGDFCSPKCASMSCPSDKPSGVTASPMCALQTTTGDKYCALLCSPTTDFKSLRAGDSQCGAGTCQPISGVGLCTYSQ